MAVDYKFYPMKSFRFKVELDNEELHCSEVSGVETGYEEVEFRNGSDPGDVKHKQRGLVTNSNITLKSGMTESLNWFKFVYDQVGGETVRKLLVISLLGDDGTTVIASWQVKEAWPVKWTGPDLNSTSSEVAFESIEICHEGIVRTS